MTMTIVLCAHKFNQQATKHHRDHLCILIIILPLSTVAKKTPKQKQKRKKTHKKHILLQWQLNYGVWTDWFQKLLYCICSNTYVDYIMVFGLEQEDGRANNPISLAHPLHPIRSRWRKNAETCGLDDVFPPDDLSSGQHTQFIIIHIPCIIATSYFLSNWNNTYQEWVWPWRCVGWYDTFILSRPVSNVYFNYTVQNSVHHNMDISTMWHCASVICTPLYSIGMDLGCALFRSCCCSCCSVNVHLPGCFRPWNSLWILDWTFYLRTPLCHA